MHTSSQKLRKSTRREKFDLAKKYVAIRKFGVYLLFSGLSVKAWAYVLSTDSLYFGVGIIISVVGLILSVWPYSLTSKVSIGNYTHIIMNSKRSKYFFLLAPIYFFSSGGGPYMAARGDLYFTFMFLLLQLIILVVVFWYELRW